MNRNTPRGPGNRQAGLTLIEFMISIVLGMILVAALSVLIANQSATRSEVDRAGRLIENGRYAIQTLADDLQMAGYWGEATDAPTTVTLSAMPDPCSTTVTSGNGATPGIQEGMALPVQGYDGSTYTSGTLACVSNWKSGTDILVLRRADPDTSDVLTGGVTDLSKLTNGQVYLQTGLTAASSTAFTYRFAAGDAGTNAATFTLVRKSGALMAPRKVLVRIYYVATCDVCSGGSADTIPTLKRVDLGVASGAPSVGAPISIAQGIENLQVDYGLDTNDDGAPDGADVSAADASLGATPSNWERVVSAKVYLLGRGTDASPGHTNTKTFAMGASHPASAPYNPGSDGFQRHLFMQSIRIVNPSIRKTS